MSTNSILRERIASKRGWDTIEYFMVYFLWLVAVPDAYLLWYRPMPDYHWHPGWHRQF